MDKEILEEIVSEAKSILNDSEADFTLTDAKGNKARIFYQYDRSSDTSGVYENALTNFDGWREGYGEDEINEDEVISEIESELNAFLFEGINQFGDSVWVDVVFDEDFDENKREFIERSCRFVWDDANAFQKEIDQY